jgi:hypothetical protein
MKKKTLAVRNMDTVNENKNITRATTGGKYAVPFPKINYFQYEYKWNWSLHG